MELSKKQLKELCYIVGGGRILSPPSNSYYNYASDWYHYRLTIMSAMLLYYNLGLIEDFDFSYSKYIEWYGNDTYGDFEDTITLKNEMSFRSVGEQLTSLYEKIGWTYSMNEDAIEDVSMFMETVNLEPSDYDEVTPISLTNKKWNIFFKVIDKHSYIKKDSAYKKLNLYMPSDFMMYFFCGEEKQYPEQGVFVHTIGFDGGECELYEEAFNVLFPAASILVDYYMDILIKKYPVLSKEMEVI